MTQSLDTPPLQQNSTTTIEIDDYVANLIEEFNKKLQDPNKGLVVKKENGKTSVAISDSDLFIKFLRAYELPRQGYEIRNIGGKLILEKEKQQSFGVDLESSIGSDGVGTGVSVKYISKELGETGLTVGLADKKKINFNWNILHMGWYDSLYAGIGPFSISNEGIRFTPFSSFSFQNIATGLLFQSIFTGVNTATSAENLGIGERILKGVFAFLGYTDDVEQAFKEEGIVGGIKAWFSEVGGRVLGIFDGVAEFIDDVFAGIATLFGVPAGSTDNSVLTSLQAIAATKKSNFIEAERLINSVLNSKDTPMWLRGHMMSFEHEYWKKRVQPFSSLLTAFSFGFHSHVPNELEDRLRKAEEFVEQKDYSQLNEQDKRKYIANLFYLIFSNKHFDKSKLIANLEFILKDMADDPSSIIILGDFLSRPLQLTNQERIDLENKLSRIFSNNPLSTQNLTQEEAQDRMKVRLARELFMIGYYNNNQGLDDKFYAEVPDSMREELKESLKRINDQLINQSILLPVLVPYALITLIKTAEYISDNPYSYIEEKLSKLPRYINTEHGFSEITGKSKIPVILSMMFNEYKKKYRVDFDRFVELAERLRETNDSSERQSILEELKRLYDQFSKDPNQSLMFAIYSYENPKKANYIDYITARTVMWVVDDDVKRFEQVKREFWEYIRSKTVTPLPTQQPPEISSNEYKVDLNSFTGDKTEMFRRARRIALGLETPNEEYVNIRVDMERLFKDKDQIEMFRNVFGDNHMYIYESFLNLKRMYPDLDPVSYVAAMVYLSKKRM